MLKKIVFSIILVSLCIIFIHNASAAQFTASNSTSLTFLATLNSGNHFINVTNTSKIDSGQITITFSGFTLGGLDIYLNGNLIGNVTNTDTSPKTLNITSNKFVFGYNNITYVPELATTATISQTDLVYLVTPYVQRGNLNMNKVQMNVTINPINTTASFIRSSSVEGSKPDGSSQFVMSVILNSTSIGFYKFDATVNTSVEWQIIEDLNISVQRGTFSYTTEVSVNKSINPVNISNTFVIESNSLNHGSNINMRGFWNSRLVNNTLISNLRGAGTSSGDLAYQVVTWNNANVQNGTIALLGIKTSSVTINAVNLSNTFVISSNSCDTNNANICFMRSYLTSTTQVTADRTNATGNGYVSYYVVSVPTINVQNGSTTLTGVLETNQTITPIKSNRGFMFNTWEEDASSVTWQRTFETYNIINTSTTRFAKGSASNGVFNKWYVIEMIDIAPPAGANSCAYTSGTWVVPCYCNITSNVVLTPPGARQNIVISGSGTFVLTANITNSASLSIIGTSPTNQCNVIFAYGGRPR